MPDLLSCVESASPKNPALRSRPHRSRGGAVDIVMAKRMLPNVFVIFVQKSWLDTIGDVAGLLVIVKEKNDCISILAGKYDVNYPFVNAQLARKDLAEDDECFLPAMIPSHLVSGIFDMTKKETSKYGFRDPKKP